MHSFRTRGSKLNDMQLDRIRWHAGDVGSPITCLSVFPAVVVRGSWRYLCPDGRAARMATDMHSCPAIYTAVGLCGVSECRTILRYVLVFFGGLLSEAVKTADVDVLRAYANDGNVLDMLRYEHRKGAEKSQLDSRAYFELHD
ncbi:hypothetical protein KVT40_006247 [Elsinoe batatas]|uniref:Uncharacterized protein n=1 Tax=Elsinoe batatas TaxID=2601811 RepID=A0A8K0PDL7_9PEZI|nr:hypothetical protein KVT40_006247 [Elsinoe batatas]